MAYWWVSQNQTYRQERGGGFLWAPKQNEDGVTFFHWSNMDRVQPGDVIFSYVGSKIVAVSVAKTAAYDSPRPTDLGEGLWEDAGNRVDVEYRDLPTPIVINEVVSQLQPLLPERYSPLNRAGTGNQGYLFGLPPLAGRLLLDLLEGDWAETVEEGISQAVKNVTERRALVLSRVGQGQFRDSLMRLWGGRCSVTGLDIIPLLRASHIKPWRDSDNRERLDPFNGLLLSPSYDATFDSGMISFGNDGGILISGGLGSNQTGLLGIDQAAHIDGLDDRHRVYLHHHRDNVFSRQGNP